MENKQYSVSNKVAHNVEFYRNYLYNHDMNNTTEFKELTEIVENFCANNYRGFIKVNGKQFGLIKKCTQWATERRS